MLPIRVRQFPRFVIQAFQRSLLLRRRVTKKPMFRLCFFSCQSYFRYLYCSVHSLKTVLENIRYEVIVFSDSEMPLSEAQVGVLRQILPGVRVLAWPKSMGWGADQIGWIWKAYALASEGLEDNDIVARVDSDVFFFNDRVFRAVEQSDADFVGDGHYVNFRYCQGGCYFFKAGAVRRILAMQQRETLESLLREVEVVVEDVAAHCFAKRLGMSIWMTWIMMFPDELRNAGGIGPWVRWKFSCAHFVMRNKAIMLEAYEKEILKGVVPSSYQSALRTE